jgi:hypothetical protein
MSKNVFRHLDGANHYGVELNDEIEVLKTLRGVSDRTAVANYFQLLAIPTFNQKYPNPDMFIEVLKLAGFGRMSIDRTHRAIKKRLMSFDSIFGNKHPTVGKMIREVLQKITA